MRILGPKPPPDPPTLRQRAVGWLLRLLFGVNVLCVLPLALMLLAPYVSAGTQFWPSLFGLLAPYPLLLPLPWVALWVWRRRWTYLAANLLLLGLGWNVPAKWYGWNSPAPPSRYDFRVLSLNAKAFNYRKGHFLKVLDWLKAHPAEVVVLQEFFDVPDLRTRQRVAISLLKRGLKLPHVHYAELLKNRAYGLAVFSKYPIVKAGLVPGTHTSTNAAMFVDVVLYGDTLRIYNLHLESYRFAGAERAWMDTPVGQQPTNPTETRSLWQWVKALLKAWRLQEQQVEALKRHPGFTQPRNLVCGDLNNPPSTWPYRQLARGRTDSFVARGQGFGSTYHMGVRNYRLDYVLAGPGLRVLQHEVLDTQTLSDHKALRVRLRLAR